MHLSAAKKKQKNIVKEKNLCYNCYMDLDIYLHAAKEGESGKKFASFYQLLLAYNEKFNLTRIVSEEDCLIKHFADSLAGKNISKRAPAS